MTKSGSIDIGPPLARPSATSSPHGFVRVDGANPTSFVYDDGRRFLPIGQTYYEITRNARWNGDWRAAIDGTAAAGFTKVRVAVFGWDLPWTTTDPRFALQCGATDHWCQSSPFLDSGMFGHRTPDEGHFAALDAVVEAAAGKGLEVDLELFVDSASAFHCNASPGQCRSAQSWANTGDWVDDAYVEYVTARYSAFPNVEWTLANEFEGTPHPQASAGGYWEQIANVLRSRDPYFSGTRGDRALSIHPNTNPSGSPTEPPVFPFLGATAHMWATTVDVQWGTQVPPGAEECSPDQWAQAAVAANLRAGQSSFPVADEEYGYVNGIAEGPCGRTFNFTRADNREALWVLATSGGYGSSGDSSPTPVRDANGAVEVVDSGDWHPLDAYRDVFAFVRFWDDSGIPYWAMQPDQANTPARPFLAVDGSSHSTYALSDPGKVTIAYQTSTATPPRYNQGPPSGAITLALPEGSYAIYAMDPTRVFVSRTAAPLDHVASRQPFTVTYCQYRLAPGCRASARIESSDWVVFAKPEK